MIGPFDIADEPQRWREAYPEPTFFDYHAKVDILGWEFTVLTSGELRIKTSRFAPVLHDDGTTSAEMRLAAGSRALVEALLAIDKGEGRTEPYPAGQTGVGVAL